LYKLEGQYWKCKNCINIFNYVRVACLLCLLAFFINTSIAQICGTPGLDGAVNVSKSINTYFPPLGDVVLAAGAKTINLAAVPADDFYGNNFGTEPIKAGDLLLVIQMQDAAINYSNNSNYGANNTASGPDNLGGTGFTSLGNSGRFEYLIATNAVPLTGGMLTFKGSGAGGGAVFSYTNAAPTTTSGKKTFEVVRVPQYSNLVLTSNISTPPFNGRAGGIIAFDVAGSMDFAGFTIDASSKGFRGGYGIIAPSDANINNLYVVGSYDTRSVGKGESIAGTPRYMWDGYNQVDNTDEGLPGGSYGKGAPANGGGGGCDHNAGGGGGGNGGAGGVGGDGTGFGGNGPGTYPNGGRPGSITYAGATPDISRLIMGGGGGGGDANDALTGVKGGVGGGIILVNVGTITGSGTILANGGNGAIGQYGNNPDGAGGGGAGGTVFIKVSNADAAANLMVEAKGGNGGNTAGDRTDDEHGPGGGGGGGLVYYAMSSGTVNVVVDKGKSGISNSGAGIPHNAGDGVVGKSLPFLASDLPAYLQGGGTICFPHVNTSMAAVNLPAKIYPGSTFIYRIKAVNIGSGNAGGVQVETQLPAGFTYSSATVIYTGNAGGPATISNIGTANKPLLGDFNISPNDTAIIELVAQVGCAVPTGKYHTSAQTIYFDPTRTRNDNLRRITGQANAFTGAKVTYETGAAGFVPGINYNGNLAAATADDITVVASSALLNNTIAIANPPIVFCVNGDPGIITGSAPTGGSDVYTYQWQSSANNIDFTDVPATDTKDFDPPVASATIYYRRVVNSLSCDPPIISNVVTITVLPAVSNNIVTAPAVAAFCSPGGNPAAITGSVPTGGNGTYTYQWQSSADNINFTPIQGAAAKDFDPGNIAVTTYYRRTAAAGVCSNPSISDTVTITINPSPQLSSSLTPPDLCSNAIFNYTPSSNMTGTVFTWARAVTADISNPVASGTNNPAETLVNTGTAIAKATFTFTLTAGGCSTVQNVVVNVLPSPALTSTLTPLDICTNAVFNYIPTSATAGTGFAWSRAAVEGISNSAATGAGNPGETLINTTQLPVTVSYNYTLTTGACSSANPIVVKVKVNPLPVAGFSVPDFCLNDGTAKFTNQSTNPGGTVAQLGYAWNFGDPNANPQRPNTSTDKDAAHVYTKTGEYTVALTATSAQGCVNSISKIFTVNGSSPKADFIVKNATALCSNAAVEFEDKATVDFGEITKIEWYYDFGNAPTVKVTDDNPAARSGTARNYTYTYPVFYSPASEQITVKMVAYSGISCVSEKSTVITVNASPEVAFTAINAVCQQVAAFQITQAKEVHGVLTGSGIYTGNGISSQGMFNPATAGEGSHTITYTFTAINGCKDEKTQVIAVNPSPAITASNTQVLEGGQVVLQATNSGVEASYKWTPATSLSRDNILTPIATPKQDILYTITATSSANCEAKATVFVTVIKNPVVPNTFSPNGDGINDVWNIPYLNTFPNVSVQVFDRYGRQVYKSAGYSIPWNGRVGGKDLPIGTYYYIINPEGGRKPMQGAVTILR
jgi:gliding motility-associated-like protein/uncharacterized repeat protein (TIGR01451 family)